MRRIRFLDLFDTVNSVPRFETAWMERSKFPYTAKSSAKVIRYAVSIDERRAKFRQDLIYQSSGRHHDGKSHAHPEHHHHMGQMMHDVHEKYRHRPSLAVPNSSSKPGTVGSENGAGKARDGRGRQFGIAAVTQEGSDPLPY